MEGGVFQISQWKKLLLELIRQGPPAGEMTAAGPSSSIAVQH